MSHARRSRRRAAALVVLLVTGCAAMQPLVRPRIWDSYANSQPLPVHGADSSTAGQLVYQELKKEPRLATFLADQGEPDTIQVVGGRTSQKRFVLTYTRRGISNPRRIQIDPSGDGYIARAPEPVATIAPEPPRPSPKRPARPRTRRTPIGASPAPQATPVAELGPTRQQMLECPIDRANPACQAFCTPGATYEWCR